MGKKLPNTPRSKVTSVLRRLFMYSRERNATLKRDGKQCVKCGCKEHLRVHHKTEIPWDEIIKPIMKYLLCDKSALVTLCKDCHNKVHYGEKK